MVKQIKPLIETLACPIQQQCQQQGNTIAIYTGEQSTPISYAQLDARVTALGLSQVPQGEVLAVIDADPLTLIIFMLACLRQKIIFCPINPIFSAEEITQRCAQAGIHYYYAPLPLPLPDMQRITLSKPRCTETALSLSQPCTLVFTSGSSGHAKAAQHSLANHYYSALGSQQLIPFHPQDCWLLSLPLYHIGGIALVLRAFFAGGSVALGSKDIHHDLSQWPITHASLVPTQVYRLLQQPTLINIKLRYLLVGGAALNNQLIQQLAALPFKSYASYGLTEMSSQVASVQLTANSQQPLYYQVLPDRQVVVTEQEIVLRGACLFMGYRQHGQLVPVDANLGFHSRDLGAITECGLTVLGRKDNMFISGGENVQPEQIEQILLNRPYIKNALVVAIPDAEFGHLAVAYVDWKNEAKLAQFHQDCQRDLAPWQRPKHLLPWPQWQGLKPNRQALQQLAIAQLD